MASAREVLAAIARAMEGAGGASPQSGLERQLGTPMVMSGYDLPDTRRPYGPTLGEVRPTYGPQMPGPQQPLQGPAQMQGPATMGSRPQLRPDMRMGFPPETRYNIHNPPGGAPPGPMHGPPQTRPVGPLAPSGIKGVPYDRYTMQIGGEPVSRTAGRGAPVNPRNLPVLHGGYGPPKPGSAGAARAMAGQAAGGEIRAATAAMNRPLQGPAMMQGPATMSGAGPFNPNKRPGGTYWQDTSPYGQKGAGGRVYGGAPGQSRIGALGGTGPYDSGPRAGGKLPAVYDPKVAKAGATSFGGFAGWAKGRHKPWQIAANYTKTIKGVKAAGPAAEMSTRLGKMGMGGVTQRIAKAGIGPSTLGFLRAANPTMATAMVGSFLLGDRFDEGTKGDVVAEGLMVGAAFGAGFGGIGALVGAPAFMALNLVTGGAAANLVQALPVVGSLFGGTGEKEIQPLDIAKDMFANAASAQGMSPEVADAAMKNFTAYWQMAEADMIGREQLVSMMYQSGRMAGFTGYPWTPEALNPAYSAEDLSAIAQGIGTAMEPFYGVATGLANMDYSHIQDADLREKLEINSQEIAGNLLMGMQQQAATPAVTAITSEAQARQGSSAALGGQLSDPFEQALLSGMG